MTVEADIKSTLSSLVAGRVFPDFAPLGTSTPFIVYEQNGGEALSYVDGTLPDKEHGRFEIGAYADSRSQAKSIIKQVEQAMSAAAAFQATADNAPISDYAPDVKIYSSTQNFSVFSTR